MKLIKVAVFSLSAVLAQASFADPPSRGRPTPERLELFADPMGFFDTLRRVLGQAPPAAKVASAWGLNEEPGAGTEADLTIPASVAYARSSRTRRSVLAGLRDVTRHD